MGEDEFVFLVGKLDKFKKYRNYTIVGGIIVNVIVGVIVCKLDLPLYLDTIGTIGVSAVCGLFPGILVGVLTNFICSLFNPYAIYYMSISAIIAFITAIFVHEKLFEKSRWYKLLFPALLAVISGGLSTMYQWTLLGENQFHYATDTASAITAATGWNMVLTSAFVNIALNFVDKSLATVIVCAVGYFIPREYVKKLWDSGWKQRPLTPEEIKNNKATLQEGEYSVRFKMALMLGTAAVTVTLIMGWISVSQYIENARMEAEESAVLMSNYVSEFVSTDNVENFLKKGETSKDYADVEQQFEDICESTLQIENIYVVKPREDGFYCVIGHSNGDVEFKSGEKMVVSESMKEQLDAFLAGDEIEPLVVTENFSWKLTSFKPIKNTKGITVAYACTDVTLDYFSGYFMRFVVKVIMIFSGFLALILVFAIWMSETYLVHPINSMASWTDEFVTHSKDQVEMDQAVKELREIEIATHDELEWLYRSLCRMAVDTSNHMRDINYFADATVKMQNGLIITMADMVENRDSDTGAHVQKTAAYVEIIAKSLRKNEYYLEKVTPKFISDAVMSAPLHDVGKIMISDMILNKPGKLTDEEYEIMKSHTTHGKEIMEKAIATVEGESYLKEARNMAAYHHERWDGKGYPEGLRGEVIPLSARIMSVADVFDALTSRRVYKPAFPLEKALEIIQEGSGTQFDPKCVDAFLDALPEVKQVLKKYQDR